MHTNLQYTNFEASFKKISWEAKKFMHFLLSKTWKIGYFSGFDGPHEKKIKNSVSSVHVALQYMNLRPHWRQSVENRKSVCIFSVKNLNLKNRLFFEFWRPPWPKIENPASSVHAALQYLNFEASLKKLVEKRKSVCIFMVTTIGIFFGFWRPPDPK